MKKLGWLICVVMVVVLVGAALVGCSPNRADIDGMIDLTEVDYKTFDVKSGLDSVELYEKAVAYSKGDEGFSYTILFNFDAGMIASQASKDVVKKDGNKLFHEQITVGKGQGDDPKAFVRYFVDGKGQQVTTDGLSKKDRAKMVPGYNNKDESKLFEYDLSSVSKVDIDGKVLDYAAYKDYKNYNEFAYHKAQDIVWIYDYSQEKLSKEHDSKVYSKDGMYYCDITIATNGVKRADLIKIQPDVVADVELAVGMKLTSFTQDVVLRMQLEKVGDDYRFIATHLAESYNASVASATQSFQRTYSYDKKSYGITAEDINLFK